MRVEAGRLKRGDLVLLVSVGAGFTVGAVLLRWGLKEYVSSADSVDGRTAAAIDMSKPRVTRIRQLTPGQAQRLEALRKIAQLLDSAFLVPGTSYAHRPRSDPRPRSRLGDLVSPLFTIGILWQARELGIPKVVQLRMIFNVAIDALRRRRAAASATCSTSPGRRTT